MPIIDSALSILSTADRQVEINAQNISNMTSPGYRAQRPFQIMVASGDIDGNPTPAVRSSADFTVGKINTTGNPYDLALQSNGFFVVRSGDAIRYTRDGQFSRDTDGRLVTRDGWALQSDAGDLILKSDRIEIAADGTVSDDGQPIAHILVRDFQDKSGLQPMGAAAFAAGGGSSMDIEHPDIRQGALESANVSTGEEMIAMMKALRSAETGQRLVQVYDDLMARAVSSFGQVDA